MTTTIEHPAAKASTALGVSTIAGVSAADWAAWLAAAYTTLLICEWLWKKVIRPFLQSRGWLPHPKRRASDRAEKPNG